MRTRNLVAVTCLVLVAATSLTVGQIVSPWRANKQIASCAPSGEFVAIEEPKSRGYTIPSLDLANEKHRQVILYGEIYGSRVQKLHYGMRGGLGFGAFDLYVDERYLDYDELEALCDRHKVPIVPLLGRGPYSLDFVKSLSGGKTTLPDNHIREGVVVKPVKEQLDPKIGRLILKYLSDDYLLNDKLTAADATDM